MDYFLFFTKLLLSRNIFSILGTPIVTPPGPSAIQHLAVATSHAVHTEYWDGVATAPSGTGLADEIPHQGARRRPLKQRTTSHLPNRADSQEPAKVRTWRGACLGRCCPVCPTAAPRTPKSRQRRPRRRRPHQRKPRWRKPKPRGGRSLRWPCSPPVLPRRPDPLVPAQRGRGRDAAAKPACRSTPETPTADPADEAEQGTPSRGPPLR
ncbi:hypothetical protein C2845_PM01G40260 [Panicum miliaceum]|uniref:Uncharacterized protein n=1 Tax=Panicum miliaceum TaxID=4540 RepID=A0A3L6TNG9_PANMI|nr:hypothetical protein C2845_PM01G40260 [Panicum miliaceum]